MVNGNAGSQPWPAFPRLVERGNSRRQLSGVIGDQRQTVCARRQHGQFPIAAGLTVPAFGIQARVRPRLSHRVLKVFLDPRLLSRMTLAESLDINSD